MKNIMMMNYQQEDYKGYLNIIFKDILLKIIDNHFYG